MDRPMPNLHLCYAFSFLMSCVVALVVVTHRALGLLGVATTRGRLLSARWRFDRRVCESFEGEREGCHNAHSTGMLHGTNPE